MSDNAAYMRRYREKRPEYVAYERLRRKAQGIATKRLRTKYSDEYRRYVHIELARLLRGNNEKPKK